MKKIFLVLVLLTVVIGNVYAGENPASKSIALNAATFTAITVDAGAYDVGVVTSDSTAWIFSDDAAGTVPITIPAPGTYSIDCREGNSAGVLFWAKASAGTPTLSVLVGTCRK